MVLTFLNPRNKSKIKAGIPIITLKLNGGIASIAILNKDQTEVQTKIKRIRRKIGISGFEKFNPISNLIFS